ncbi:MAG: hypothetical protein NZ571_06890 [Anaerolineae bacterium]|nr:hypothetical protein [Anaerolineae bacterium]
MRWISALILLSILLSSSMTSHAKGRLLMTWSATNNMIALGVEDQVRLYDAHTQQLLAVLGGRGAALTALAWQPEGVLLATGDANGRLCLWSVPDFRQECSTAESSDIRALAWQANGARLAAAGSDRVQIWQTRPLALIAEWSAEGIVTALAWQGDRLAVGGALRGTYEQGFLVRYDSIGNLQDRYTAELRPPLSLQSLGDDLLGVGTLFDVFIWQVTSRHYRPLYLPLGEGEFVHQVTWSPDAARALVLLGNRLLCFSETMPHSELKLTVPAEALIWHVEAGYIVLLTENGSLSLIEAVKCG